MLPSESNGSTTPGGQRPNPSATSIDSESAAGQRRIVSMSEAPHEHEPTVGPSTIEELARIQHAQPVADLDELVEDIWESDEELDAFLADLRASRNASLA
jgi:hypothetical protein